MISGWFCQTPFGFVNTFITKKAPHAHMLPSHNNSYGLANTFNDFFVRKIMNIRNEISTFNSCPTTEAHTAGGLLSYTEPSVACLSELHTTTPVNDDLRIDLNLSTKPHSLSSLQLTDDAEILSILKESAIKVSPDDPLPAFLVKECIDILLPYFTVLVNLSLSLPSFDTLKMATIVPALKQSGLDPETLKNYRPISLLPFISKLTARVVFKRLVLHMSFHNLNSPSQYGYKNTMGLKQFF